MAVGDQVTRPGQVQYGDLLLGAGTPYRWRGITGWEELPALDSGTVPRSDAHGAFPGGLLATARTIGLDGLVIRAPRASVGAVVAALNRGTVPVEDELPLVAWLDERGPLLAFARATRRAVPATLGYRLGTITGGALEFVATDPRRYGLVEQVAPATLPAPESGLVWDTDPEQALDADQAAGVGELWRWWTDGDPVLAGDGVGTVSVRPLTPGGELVWSAEASDYGWPVSVGAEVAFTSALAAAQGATIILRWWDVAGTYLADSTGDGGDGTIAATAPAGAAWVQPVVLLPDALAAPVPVGTSSLLIGSPSGGLSWPLDFGTPGSTGTLSVVNAGDASTHPLIEFRGPMERPSITNVDTGDVLEYDLPLAAEDLLAIDTAAGTVTLNATASRIYTATSRSVPEQTWTLPPGASQLHFRAVSGDPAATATVRYRPAYW
ncbi:phage distal tail protein [Streptomyces sp. NPDC060322]|uniref:phage distal tail protein n=1 Tax=Streptomyces sp. NPDC060322 TaxID=3347097 RepID=UPI0036537103